MLHSILIGLDCTLHDSSTVQLGIEWAQRYDALLVGLGSSTSRASPGRRRCSWEGYPTPIRSSIRLGWRTPATRWIKPWSNSALRCAEAGVACKALEDVGSPCEQLVLQSQRYDLILLGRQTRFHFEIQDQHNDTVPRVLKSSPRPVVLVPETWSEGRSVVIAYDESFQAARALSEFQNAGLSGSLDVHVVSIHADRLKAARQAERAVDYLRFHAIKATAHPLILSGSPSEMILEQTRQLEAGLLVIGAYGQPTYRELILGSVTKALLRDSPVPLFLFH